MDKILCSGCLLGIKCRYDGKTSKNSKVIRLLKDSVLIPVCPEQLGGLKTPREMAEIRGDRVVTISGLDVTESFFKGAEEVLYIARTLRIKQAILKQYSPSCGCGKVYDGTFTKKVITGDGITTALLKQHGISVISEEEL